MATASDNPSPSIIDLISSYSILSTLAPWLSTLDLFHLGLTSRSAHSYILSSPAIFECLARQCLCDGRGLAKRQASDWLPPDRDQIIPITPQNVNMHGDEEIEVRLWNIKCDATGALPCVHCGINICEECRFRPRAAPCVYSPNRRPHLNSVRKLKSIYFLCPTCDAAKEQEVAGKFLNELCDCDRYTRWICLKCKMEEDDFTEDYFDKYSLMEWDWGPEWDGVNAAVFGGSRAYSEAPSGPSMVVADHGRNRAFWCICGATLERGTIPRCTWCRRRHRPLNEWMRESRELGRVLPFFDNDPDYPRWSNDMNGNYPTPYPRLGYRRPGEDELEHPQWHLWMG